MTNFNHIVFGYSASGCVKYFFQQNSTNFYNGKIFNFHDDLSIGPLYNLEQNILERYKYINKVYGLYGFKINFDDLLKLYNVNLELNKNIVIWHGYNTIDQIGLKYFVNKYKDYNIYEIDVSECILKEYNGQQYRIRSVAECSIDDIERAVDFIKIMDDNRKEKLAAEWEELNKQDSRLRILEDNKIIGVNEDYYDSNIIKFTTREYTKAARVIGTVLGMSHHYVTDGYINYRIKELIQQNKIIGRGDSKQIRSLEIKLQ